MPSRADAPIGMCAPHIRGTVGLSIAQILLPGLASQGVQLGLNSQSLLHHSTRSNPSLNCFAMLFFCFWFVYQLFWFVFVVVFDLLELFFVS